jgi:hypothetical protein
MTPKPKLATCFFWWNKAGGGQTVIHLGQSTTTRCEQQQQHFFIFCVFCPVSYFDSVVIEQMPGLFDKPRGKLVNQ